MRNDQTIFRTVRELLVNRDDVLMGNAVDTEGKLYDDSVENLTAILAMQDSYNDLLAALGALIADCEAHGLTDNDAHLREARAAITKAKGN
jgi:hypothetical protein